MQLFRSLYRSWVVPVLFLLIAVSLTACGGGSSSSGGGNGNATKVTITPSPTTSLNFGQVFEIIALAQDSSGVNQNNKITWSSSDTSLVSLAADGTKCGGDTTTNTMCLCVGTWKDNTYVDCIPPAGSASGTSIITATSGSLSSTLTVYVHPQVKRVTISTPVTDCTSSKGTVEATATAYDTDGNVVNVGPSDQTGFVFQTSDSNIVTSDTKGLLTAVNPGVANIYATSSNVTSTPVPFTTCGVKSIKLHVKDGTDTSFTVDKGTSKTLVADVVDTKDKTITITNSKLTFASVNNGIVAVDTSGNVTTPGPGSSAITASCAPPNCNVGLGPVFSNPVVANVNGTAATSVYVLSASSTSLYPIDTSTDTVGTAITLPANPSSIIFARTGLGAYFSTDTALYAFDATKNATGLVSNTPGRVVAVSNDGGNVVLFDNSTNTVRVIKNTGSSVTAYAQFIVPNIPNPCETTNQCPRASFTPDSSTAYIVADGNLYIASSSTSLKTIPLGQTGIDVTSEQGSFAFIAGASNSVDVFATCNNAKLGSNSVALSSVPQRIASTVDASKVFTIAGPAMNVISPSSDYVGCPPSLTDPLASFDLGQGTFTTRQLLVTSNGAKVIAITDSKVIVFNTADNTTSAITLSGGATPTTGGITMDNTSLYVGGSDKNIHKIDLTTNSETKQISVTITPDFVVVRTE